MIDISVVNCNISIYTVVNKEIANQNEYPFSCRYATKEYLYVYDM